MAQANPPTETIEDFVTCAICHGNLKDTAITTCGHRYCSSCIKQWLDHSETRCPCCNYQLSRNSLIQDRQFDSFVEIVKIELQNHEITKAEKETFQDELNSLRESLASQAQTHKKESEKTISIFQQETKRLKEEISSKEQSFKKDKDNLLLKISSAHAQTREKEQSLKETEGKLEKEKALTSKLQDELVESQNCCKLLNAEIDFLNREKAMLQSNLESLCQIDETCRFLQEKITDIEDDKRSIIVKMGKMSSEINELQQQDVEHKETLMRSKHEVSQLKQELKEIKDRNKRMNENNKSLQMKIDGLTEDLYRKEQNLIYSRHLIVPEQ